MANGAVLENLVYSQSLHVWACSRTPWLWSNRVSKLVYVGGACDRSHVYSSRLGL